MNLEKLFDQFLREKQYLQGCAPNTIIYYRKCYKAYKAAVPEAPLPTTESINKFVIGMRERGVSVGCTNTYIRGFNTLLQWLYANGHIVEKLSISLLKKEKRVLRAFADDELKKIVRYRPRNFSERRLHVLLLALMDTGCRIDEMLSLTRDKLDFDNLLLTVRGKGDKERVIPISVDLRKILFRFLGQHQYDLVFASRTGTKMIYQNLHKQFERLCKRVGVEPAGFHSFRRTFARNYLRNGGNLIYLQTALGHNDIHTTRKYVEVETADLVNTHLRTSILSRLR